MLIDIPVEYHTPDHDEESGEAGCHKHVWFQNADLSSPSVQFIVLVDSVSGHIRY